MVVKYGVYDLILLIITFLDFVEGGDNMEGYLYNIIDTLDLPIVRLSYPDLSIIAINQKAKYCVCGMIGSDMTYLEAIKPGESICKIFPIFNTAENMECIHDTVRTRQIVYRDYFQTAFYGRRRCYKVIYQPIIAEQGEMAEIIIIAMDITHEIEEKENIESMLKMKDEFFSFIAHEFKTPLTVISAAIQAMESLCKKELSEKAKGFMAKIRQNVFRQLRLVNNILDMARANSGHTKLHIKNIDIVALTRAITDSVLIYAKQKGVEIIFSSLLVKKLIAIDDEKYERILLNLLSNSIKFTPQGKRIYVRVSKMRRKICVEVKDEGVGIPKDKQNIIFECFGQVDSNLTRKSEGTGIGLSLVKVLVAALGGEITVDSEEGKGSTFVILLPGKKVPDDAIEAELKEIVDNRLIQSAAIEFSDIYL